MRHINREDTAFYYGRLVTKIRNSLVPKGKVFGDFGEKKRRMLTEQAIDVVHDLINDENMMNVIKTLADRD